MPPYAQMTIRGRGGALPRYSGGDSVYAPGRNVSARFATQSGEYINIANNAAMGALRARGNFGQELIQFGQTVNMWENNYAKTTRIIPIHMYLPFVKNKHIVFHRF